MVLEFEGNKALINADVQDRKVFIYISGPLEGRRRLLAIVRSDFERIHRDIKRLQPIEMVPVKERPDVVIPYAELRVWEESGAEKFRKVIDNAVVELDVREMLNGVDVDGSRRSAVDREREALRVFCSYSHKDETLRKRLEAHLKLLQRQGLISTWHDRKIAAGEEWKGKIAGNMEAAHLILLMISAEFIASDYCYDLELKRALERHNSHQARVIPIILRDVDWQNAAFGKLQALPKDGKPVMLWQNKDSAWKDVAEGIRKVVEEIRNQHRGGDANFVSEIAAF